MLLGGYATLALVAEEELAASDGGAVAVRDLCGRLGEPLDGWHGTGALL